ncbi:hypothetical protein [Gimesia aquarii]|uniref:Uncharacterized protein n=1 Tax=Gimesia aquarii TaxID=2527964 RepID=A0A517X1J3_9PLAN|nr:hypothetical protein [Gimesia aquarii]QDU11373.1 hypothetical protein V202x_47940 [Gimesia aquarii]
MLYEIREENGSFKLFVSKKKGLKFKKSFSKRDSAEWFIKTYLSHCCLICQEQGWVYKTRCSGGLRGGGSKHGRGWNGMPHWGNPPIGTIVACPECRAKHQVLRDHSMKLKLLEND